MLKQAHTMLMLVDVQGNLAQAMYEKARLFKSLQILVEGTQSLSLPMVWAEQIPTKLGATIPEVAGLIKETQPIAKETFSCCQTPALMSAIENTGRRQILIAGIEAHICVYQTAADLILRGFEVHVVSDAVSSRTAENKAVGLSLIQTQGGTLTSVEACLFELLRAARGEAFKKIVKLVK